MNKVHNRVRFIMMVIMIFVLQISVIFMVSIRKKADLSENMERRAYAELKASIENHKDYTEKMIEQEFNSLHTLAAYFGLKDNFTFEDELEIANAMALENDYYSLGFIDSDGNAMNYTGENIGDLSKEKFFSDAVKGMGTDTIAYRLTADGIDEPHIILSTPVRYRNHMIGVVYAVMRMEEFNSKLASNNYNGSEKIFVTDSAGTVIMSNQTAEEHIVGENLFESHKKEHFMGDYLYEQLLVDIERGRDGQFQIMHGEPEYVAFTPMEINDWVIYSMVPVRTANEQFSQNKEHVERIVNSFTVAFLAVLAVACAMLLVWNWSFVHYSKKEWQENKRHNHFLVETGRAVYEYDVSLQKAFFSDNLKELLGYEPPANLLSLISERKKLHPEMDYDMLLHKVLTVITNGKKDHMYLQLQTEKGGLRRLHVDFVPFADENENVVRVYGMITDVTDQEQLAIEAAEASDAHGVMLSERERASSGQSGVKKKIEVRTFGNFDLFVDGVPIHFTGAKTKELLAILIDRKGGTLTSEEAIAILWEDEPAGEKQLARYRKMASRLKEVLEKAGCGEILITDNGIRSIDVTKIECDYYQALDGDKKAIKQYHGEYMVNYSWAESKTALLNQLLDFSPLL